MKGEEKGNLNWRERKNDLRSFPVTKSRCSNLEKLFDGNGSCYQIKMFQPKTILLLMETQMKLKKILPIVSSQKEEPGIVRVWAMAGLHLMI